MKPFSCNGDLGAPANIMRVATFIDGFNVYHALDDDLGTGVKAYARFKWIDYWKLAEQYLKPGDALESVHLFTAYCPWSSSKRERHRNLVRIQEDRGVVVKLGYFRSRTLTCKATGGCGLTYPTHEEKRTDVNVATTMLSLAFRGLFNKAVLVSGDSDYIPVIEEMRAVLPHITIVNVVPIKREAKAIRNAVHAQLEMRQKHLVASRLADPAILRDGTCIPCPQEWK
jgi:hypothetical protein